MTLELLLVLDLSHISKDHPAYYVHTSKVGLAGWMIAWFIELSQFELHMSHETL